MAWNFAQEPCAKFQAMQYVSISWERPNSLTQKGFDMFLHVFTFFDTKKIQELLCPSTPCCIMLYQNDKCIKQNASKSIKMHDTSIYIGNHMESSGYKRKQETSRNHKMIQEAKNRRCSMDVTLISPGITWPKKQYETIRFGIVETF